MGRPAGRLGDLTMHGGTVVVGMPTVLIGGQPAARLTDMHVCPMATPAPVPVPHVGGPMSMLGSPTVLIGGMPSVRAMDMGICVGPPDAVAVGFPTVLIGEVGTATVTPGGGAGAAGAGGSGAMAAAFSALMAMSSGGGAGTTTSAAGGGEGTTQEAHWIEFQFVDSAGNPTGGVPFEFTAPDGQVSTGMLGANGRIYWSGPDAGQATAILKFVSNARWSEDTAEVGQTVTMSADVEGFDPGTPATFRIYKRDLRGADELMDTIETETQADSVEADWEYVFDGENDSPREGTQGGYSAPEYYFDVTVERSSARSDLLEYRDYIEVEVTDDDGNPMADEEYILYLPNGAVRTGTLDGSGCLREENVPPGFCSIRFPNLPAFRDLE